MKAILFAFVLAVILIVPVIQAETPSVEYCINNTHLGKNITWFDGTDWATFHFLKECQYNCSWSESRCKPSPFESNLWVLGLIILFIGLMVVVMKIK